MNYVIKDFNIEDLLINPENARFINPDEVLDEISAINQIIDLNPVHVINLARDVAVNGLNPNELPIVMKDPEDNIILVMDGNRRISSIKLMTQYKDHLDNFNLSSTQKRELQSLNCDIAAIKCVFCSNEDEVNSLLEKLHTSKPGVSRVNWDPQAQDRHNHKNGTISKRLAIVKMLNCSRYTSSEAKETLKETGWLSKLKRFTPDKYISFFGITFDTNNDILLHIEESEVMKGLSRLIVDLRNTRADDIAQTEETRLKYLDNFDTSFKPNLSKLISPLVKFDTTKEEFILTDIINKSIESSTGSDSSDTTETTNNEDKENDKKTKLDEIKESKPDDTKESNDVIDKPKGYDSNKDNEETSTYGIDPTLARNTLIPRDENIPIKNQRVADLYSELKILNLDRYTNTVSIAFRSLIEFSINCYLEKHHPNWGYHEQVTLFQKLEKVLRKLEGIKGKDNLKIEIPAIYRWVDIYNKDKSKDDLVSIQGLNAIIHSHLYHPNARELKVIYNNYSPFLKLIWEQI